MDDENMNHLITAEELAAELCVRVSTIRRWTREGTIPSIWISERVIRYHFAEVLAEIRLRKRRSVRGEARDDRS